MAFSCRPAFLLKNELLQRDFQELSNSYFLEDFLVVDSATAVFIFVKDVVVILFNLLVVGNNLSGPLQNFSLLWSAS